MWSLTDLVSILHEVVTHPVTIRHLRVTCIRWTRGHRLSWLIAQRDPWIISQELSSCLLSLAVHRNICKPLKESQITHLEHNVGVGETRTWDRGRGGAIEQVSIETHTFQLKGCPSKAKRMWTYQGLFTMYSSIHYFYSYSFDTQQTYFIWRIKVILYFCSTCQLNCLKLIENLGMDPST